MPRPPAVIRTALLVLFLLDCCGCAVVRHKDQILLLKDLGDHQSRMSSQLRQQKAAFALLQQAVTANRLKAGMNRQYIETKYGEPTLCNLDTMQQATCVYRSPVSELSAPLIILRYSREETLLSWEYLP